MGDQMQRKFWLRVSGIAVGAVLAVMANGGQAAPFDRAGWLSDYAQLKTIMEKHYANLAWFGSPDGGVDIPRLDKRTLLALKSAQSDDEARLAISDFVMSFKGGHFQVLGSVAPAGAQSPGNKPAEIAHGAFSVADPAEACARLGFLPKAQVAFSVPIEGLPNFAMLSDGLSGVYRAGIVTAANGTKVGVIRVQNFTLRAFPTACTIAAAKLKAKGGDITAGDVRDAADEEWVDSLRDDLNLFKARGVTALLIDIGNNTGGDDDGDMFARLFTDKPVRSPRLQVAADAAGCDYFDEQVSDLDRRIKSLKGEGPADLSKARAFFADARQQAETACDMSWVWKERHAWAGKGCTRMIDAGYAGGYLATLPPGAYGDEETALRLSLPSRADDHWAMWTGPVYVLTDGRTFSSAEMFSAVVQDNHIGKIVGQKTGGDGCGFMGDDVPYGLDHSHMRVRMPNCVRLRADGLNEVRGIAPDIAIVPTEGEDDRQRANRLIETVAADVAN